ncbi:synaptotagmin-like protein 4 [Caerostris extrusa]|uniref:Synaptotagmin-like protein 4 n=1 Tax=Caerostris extrusa TaxID=172846 RepID=A0AAV4U472_CAEEX|nr:synaptotagmin-like protein 4 [Caerostris extrusa]
MESSIDTTAPPSPLTTSRLSSVEHENSDRTSPFEQRPTFDSSSSENEEEDCQPPLPAKSSDTLFRKVTLKKRSSGSSGTEPIKEKTPTIATDLIKCSTLGCGLKQKLNNKNVGTLANSKVHMEACAGNALSSNLEALCDGTQLNVQGDVHLEEEECVSLEGALKIHSSYKRTAKEGVAQL